MMKQQWKWQQLVSIILFFFIASFSSSITALTSNNLPDKNEIKSALNALNKKNSLSEEDKLVLADLEKTSDFYDELDKLEQRTADLQKKLSSASEESKQAAQGLLQIKNENEQLTENFLRKIQDSSLSQLKALQTSYLENLQTEQNDLATYSSQLIGLQTQPERAQAMMLENARRLQEIRNELNSSLNESVNLRPTQITMLQVEQYLLQQQNEYQKRILEANTQLQDVLQKQRDYTAAYIEQLEHHIQQVQNAISHRRLNDSQSTVREALSTSETDIKAQQNPLIQKEIAINNALSDRLITVTENSNKLVQNGIRVKTWLERATQSERNLKEQINVLRGSLLLSRILFQQQIDLPPDILTKNLPTTIADLRLEQFDVNQQRDELYQPNDYITKLEQQFEIKTGDELTNSTLLSTEDKSTLLKLLEVRRGLLDELNQQLGGQISQAINLQLDQNQLLSVVGSLENTLAQQIFWVNSNKPIDLEWVKAFPEAAATQINSFDFSLSNRSIKRGVSNSLLVVIPLVLVALLFIWFNRKINNRLQDIDQRLSSLRNDSVLSTPFAILLTLMQTLPISLFLLAFGYWFLKTGNVQGPFFWQFSQQLAIFWALFELTFRVLKPQGIAQKHFGIEKEKISQTRRRMIRLSIPLVPLIFFSTYGVSNPLKVSEDVIGQLIVLVSLILLCIFTIPFCKQVWQEKGSHLTRSIVMTLLTFSPLILVGLMMAGYYYTTLRLANRWLDSLYLLLLWYITYNACLRGLTLVARKLAYQRAIERRAMLKQEDVENEPIKEPPMTIELISQQSLRLTTMVLFIIFALAFYAIWSDFITIFSFLDSVNLWSYTATSAEGGNILQFVTLANLILALVIIIVSWVMTRNLPGLLEVLVLSRLKLRQGSTYAITTILTYIIVGIGAIASLGMIGVTWNKLQWLAAALTVGLGFGLQEIFANFVSGIILLFERPIRIGDTVTIGTYSGTVSKIRIRATTIVDFDRKEVIIPNKAFVTERLINWSLSDTVTRITIAIGVAYGSDLDKVKRVLLSAATSNNKVMTEPAPNVYFTSFGASTLDHELRFYVRQIGDRGVTSDEVNRAIDKLCRENDIDIAFNQLEVHLHNNKGDEVQEVKRRPKDSDGETH
ncbi:MULTISPECIES: mechanosensitive channel MscK [Providencia]|uniref:Mechanosensitive channel MscK n=1 Tax=Providencia rettgeri TaxID=587 RepID=A0AB35LFR3_PRORE|nr:MULTISPECIES: mechanosensitive channel MscK [Providencia]AWS52658.1 mechanosensitive channel MscK [Providencia rettgeri]ELH9584877.1 mechanosensitive channel MscK [Providencia rettgeri]ELM3938632.1 mechanosensitive channel MscK [Providencia rettgeri]ELR5288752.1 mechanosensitive channel MscK [Providencia rettgeri]ELR5295704.1 mechanosensitive channel MscK [Providencia rettgeri]